MKYNYTFIFSLLWLCTFQLLAQDGGFDIQQYISNTANDQGLSNQDVNDWVLTNSSISPKGGIFHIYIRQRHLGLEIVGANASLHLQTQNNSFTALSYHNNFFSDVANNVAQANPSIIPNLSAIEATQLVASQLGYQLRRPIEIIKSYDDEGQNLLLSTGGISLKDIPAKLVFQADNNGQLKLAWDISILELNNVDWWSIRVDATTGQILDQNNWTLTCNFGAPNTCNDNAITPNHRHNAGKDSNGNGNMVAGYNVYAVPVESPNHGGRTLVSDPSDATASPYGWHDDNGVAGAEHTITRGNNVYAYEDNNNNPISDYSPDGGASLTFNFPIDLTQAPIENEDANITNLFYWNNIIHDVAYHLGFDETSGNFQENNYSKGGLGSDYVEAEAQDGGGTNNANFSTPPDGSNPRMQMYLWTTASPSIDGDLDNGIILHEYGHGISIRLTGGASNSSCLNNSEQMGEGWSDYWGVMLTMKGTDQGTDKRGVGTYALNEATSGDGIRTYPYSTDLAINPHTYDNIKNGLSIPHGVGSVWCAMLWEMSWELINAHGFNSNLYEDAGGNNIAMQLVMEGFKLQPCSPGFVDGRDAILKADTALYGGANSCLIWRAFAKRGLGFSADQGGSGSISDGTQAFDLPPGLNENCTNDPVYAITISPNRVIACPGEDFVYTVSILGFNGYNGTVTISEANIPIGANSSLSATTFNSFPSSTTWTISNTNGVNAGEYSIAINGTDGSINQQQLATMEVSPSVGAPSLIAPTDNATVASLVQILEWTTVTGANNYDLQLATDASFNDLVIDETNLNNTSFTTPILSPNTSYYWRVRSNSCSVSSYNQASFNTASSCDTQFTDSGGSAGNHQNNELIEWVFCPDNVGDAISITFTSFDLETRGSNDCWDDLTVYNGSSTSAPSLGSFCGTTVADAPGGGTILAENASGCLTFVFDSDGSVTRSGWVADISCLDCPVPSITNIETTPESCPNTGDGTITINTSSLNVINYILTPVGGSAITNSNGVFSNLSAGDYSIMLQLQSDADCVSPAQSITLDAIITPVSMPINDFELCLSNNIPENEGLVADCGTNVCNAIVVQPNRTINASNITVCETINISGSASTVSEIYLSLKVQHEWVGDLSATLESPNGTIIQLFDGPGIPASSYGCSQNNLNLIFADTASLTAVDLENTCISSTGVGTYAIEGAFQAVDLFSTLNGEPANGDWTICIYDNYTSLDHGVLDEIKLVVNPAFATTTWWDASIDGNLLYTGVTFNPIEDGNVNPEITGNYTFWSQCECAGCPSERTAADFIISGTYYFQDGDGDGYGDATNNLVVCSGETAPGNYVTNFTDCNDGNSGDVMMMINDSPIAIGMHQANEMITSEGMVAPGPSLITFQASQTIILKPGFSVQSGGLFLAKIDTCGEYPSFSLQQNPITNTNRQSLNFTSFIQNEISIEIDLNVFPNPFKSNTEIVYHLPQKEKISLRIYDYLGRLVKTFYDGQWQEVGTYQATFDGSSFPQGMFIVVLKTKSAIITKRIVLAK